MNCESTKNIFIVNYIKINLNNIRLIIPLILCYLFTFNTNAQSYLNEPYDNRIYVSIKPYLIRANDNFETVGNNDFVFNVKVEGDEILGCFVAKIPTTPPLWIGIFDPGSLAIMAAYGGNASRYEEIPSPNGWSILKWERVIEKGEVNINLDAFEDDQKDVCILDKKDDGHCNSNHKIAFHNYPPNIKNFVKLDCSGYSVWVEIVWFPLIKKTPLKLNLCDNFNNTLLGSVCSNMCSEIGSYGKLTYSSNRPNPDVVDFDIRFRWVYEIQNEFGITLNSFSYDNINNKNNKFNYYNSPAIYDNIKNYTNLNYNLKVNLYRYIYYKGSNIGILDTVATTKGISAITPTYNGSPFTIAPTCNGGKDGQILVDIDKIVSTVIPKNIQVSYKDQNGIVYGTDENYSNGVFSIRDTLTSQNYTVQVGNFISNSTQKLVGCPLNIPVTVPVRPILIANLDTIPYTNTDVSCRNSNDGRIKLTVEGGMPPYKVTADTTQPLANWARIYTNPGRKGIHVFTGLAPEVPYNFAVSDSFNCPLNNKRRIDFINPLTNPDTLRFQYVTLSSYYKDSIYNTNWNVSCYDAQNGSITALVNEFTTAGARRYVNPPFRLWVTGTTTRGVNVLKDTVTTDQTSKVGGSPTVFNGLSAGAYTLHLLDKNNCYYFENYTLKEPPRLDVTVIDFTDNKCAGAAKGMIKTKSLGGTRPYRYYKDDQNQSSTSSNPYHLCYGIGYTTTCDNGAGNFQNDQFKKTFDTIATLSELVFGPHTLFAKDTNGCISKVTRYVNQPAPVSVTLTGKHISCKGFDDGTLKAVGSGGTPPYRYNWSFNGSTIGTSNFIDSLFPGVYNMDVLDTNNCTTADNFEIRNPTDTLKATATVSKDPTCADREDAIINVLAEGGWTPKYFSIDGTTYEKEAPNFTDLKAGLYSAIHVKDGNGCIIKLAPVSIFDPGKLTATALQTPSVSCFGGSDGKITLSISGGNSPYFAGLGSTLSDVIDSVTQIQNLSPGKYTVHIADSKNCLLDKLVTVVAPDKLQDSILNVTDASPFLSDGSATIKAFGGTGPYSYKWDNLQQNSFTGPVTLLNLSAGFKRVIITDSKQCADTTYVGINNIGGPVFVSETTIPPTCSYSTNGSTTVNFTAATALTYTWVHGPTGPSLSNLSDGIYYVTAIDANGLIATKIDTVKAPAPIEILFGSNPSPCFGDCKGELQATLKGGTQPYSLLWSDPAAQSSVIASNLCAGNYYLDITDAKGCIKADTVSLLNPTPVEVDLGTTATLCAGQVIVLDAQNPGSTYSWTSNNPDFANNTQSIEVTGDGEYYVDVITPYGCLGQDTFVLKSSKELLDALFYVSTKNYAGDTVVFVNVSYPFPESVEWLFADSVALLKSEPPYEYVIFPSAGYYTVKMTAYLGECTDTISKRIKIYEPGDEEGYNNGRKGQAIIQSLTVYPNPNDGSFQVVLKLNAEYETEILIHDFTGTVVQKTNQDKNTHFEIPFVLNQLSKGVYFVRAMAGGESLSVIVTIQ